MTKGVKGFLALGSSIEAGSLDKTKEYFACNEPGCWTDLNAAGYLLANAFRRSASTNPDSLPSVKVRIVVVAVKCTACTRILSLSRLTTARGSFVRLGRNMLKQ